MCSPAGCPYVLSSSSSSSLFPPSPSLPHHHSSMQRSWTAHTSCRHGYPADQHCFWCLLDSSHKNSFQNWIFVISPFYHVQWCTGAGSNQLMKRWWTAQLSSTFSHSHSRFRWLWSVFRPWKLLDMAKQKAEPSCPQRWNYSTAYKVPPSSDYAGVAFTPPSFVTPLSLTSHIQIITMLVEFWFWTISHVLHLLSRLLDQSTSSACHEYVRGSWLHLSL